MNLLYAVGKASKNPPLIINLFYRGNPDSEEIIALIGKGITFDSGGLNIKPTGSMETMYLDKCGACTVFSTFLGAIENKMKLNISCSMAFAENFVNENSYRPSDIIKSHKGFTVEILNTDAEGRLILADAISWT